MIKLIDKKNYLFFVYCFFGGLVGYWLIFCILGQYEPVIESTVTPKIDIGIIEYLYFSVVTISSLGYGDFHPVGIGRYVAMTEVIYGLVFLALIVSKLASERTSTLVRLIYTSDVEKRLKEFVEENNKRNLRLNRAIDGHDYLVIKELTNDYKVAFSAYLHFFAYHSKEGDIVGRWAEKVFLRLLRSVSKSVVLISGIMRLDELSVSERLRCEKALRRAINFSTALDEAYNEQNIRGNTRHISKIVTDAKNYLTRFRSGDAPPEILTNLTPELLERVRNELSDTGDEWPRHIHKDIAGKLRISKNLAHKALSKIVEEKLKSSESIIK